MAFQYQTRIIFFSIILFIPISKPIEFVQYKTWNEKCNSRMYYNILFSKFSKLYFTHNLKLNLINFINIMRLFKIFLEGKISCIKETF